MANLCPIAILGGVIEVAQNWPSSLISALALGLPVLGGFFPPKLHGFFNLSKANLDHWYSFLDFHHPIHAGTMYLLSGDVEFLRHVLALLGGF